MKYKLLLCLSLLGAFFLILGFMFYFRFRESCSDVLLADEPIVYVPDDEFSEKVIGQIGETFLYRGKTISQQITKYEFLMNDHRPESLSVLEKAVNDFCEYAPGKAEISVWDSYANTSYELFSLYNYSDEREIEPDYDGFYSLEIHVSDWNEDTNELSDYSCLENVRKLTVTDWFLEQSEDEGTNYVEIWPSRREVVIYETESKWNIIGVREDRKFIVVNGEVLGTIFYSSPKDDFYLLGNENDYIIVYYQGESFSIDDTYSSDYINHQEGIDYAIFDVNNDGFDELVFRISFFDQMKNSFYICDKSENNIFIPYRIEELATLINDNISYTYDSKENVLVVVSDNEEIEINMLDYFDDNVYISDVLYSTYSYYPCDSLIVKVEPQICLSNGMTISPVDIECRILYSDGFFQIIPETFEISYLYNKELQQNEG